MDKEKVPCGAPPRSTAHSQTPELYNPIHMLTLSNTNANEGTDTLSLQCRSQKVRQSIKPRNSPMPRWTGTQLQPRLLVFIVAEN